MLKLHELTRREKETLALNSLTSGKDIIATQEDQFAITEIDIATRKIVWRYGTPGTHGSGPNQLWNPDDAMTLPDGTVIAADIKNCRLVDLSSTSPGPASSPGRGWSTSRWPEPAPPRRSFVTGRARNRARSMPSGDARCGWRSSPCWHRSRSGTGALRCVRHDSGPGNRRVRRRGTAAPHGGG